MRHYDITEWTDFVRYVVSDERRREMESHLAGCGECAALAAVLGRVASAARNERQFEPPMESVARAAGIFSGGPAALPDMWSRLRQLLAELMFDSLNQPLAPAGARSGRPGPRQLMYRAGGYWIDLRVDEEAGGTEIRLIGQIASDSAQEGAFRHVPVVVFSGKHVIAQGVSNDFGEFTISCVPRQNLRLCLPLEGAGDWVELSLSALQIRGL